MRYPISQTIAATAAALMLVVAVSAAAVPTTRHILSGWWNNPEGLAALPENPQVHYEDCASDHARAVAALLPLALHKVTTARGPRIAIDRLRRPDRPRPDMG